MMRWLLLVGVALCECRGDAALRGSVVSHAPSRSLVGTIGTLQLIDSDTDLAVLDLTDGLVIALDEVGLSSSARLTVNATFDSSSSSSSTEENPMEAVEFVYTITSLDGADSWSRTFTENSPPFALCGNSMSNRANFKACSKRPRGRGALQMMRTGIHTLVATPLASGERGDAVQVSFTIVPSQATEYKLADLPYDFAALEPYIDTATMQLHHGKHHASAIANLNKATNTSDGSSTSTSSTATTFKTPLVDLLKNALDATPIRNNAGSHYNHALFWTNMAPFDVANATQPSAQLQALLDKSYNGTLSFKAKFNEAAAVGTLFGSGWVWLCVVPESRRRTRRLDDSLETDNTWLDDYRLEIVGTPNQDNPLMRGVTDSTMFPILGLDVWEHAYYLKYQNVRADYVTNWWNVVNWDRVSENCATVMETNQGVAVPS